MDDLYWVPGGNPDLKSETGFSWEAGMALKARSKVLGVEFTATYFQSQIDNWIIWLPNGNVWTPQNKRQVVAQGVETKLKMDATLGRVLLKLHGAYTYVSSKITEGTSATDASVGHQLIYVPIHQAKAHVSIHLQKLFLLYGHQFVGERYTTSDNEASLPAYQLSYVSVGYAFPIGKHTIGLDLTVDNLFNTEYQTIAWRPMPGRSFLINLNYQFQ